MASIKHLFVLMLENRSFDHMLGFADLAGIDAVTGGPTHADDLVQLKTRPERR
jgi:phospholipase C